MRLFVSLAINQDIKEKIMAFQKELRPDLRGLSFVKEEAMHLTLKFLGEVQDENYEAVVNVIKNAGQLDRPFKIEVLGAGVFPNWKKPKVIWVGVRELENRLENLAEEFEKSFELVGIARESRKFVPHLTIARVRGNEGLKPTLIPIAVKLVEQKADCSFGQQEVTGVNLMKSILTPTGAVYSTLLSQAFKG